MCVPEKSDCAVLPVNQPNKGGQSSAEVGEGRAQTKENIVQSHVHPTQSGKRMSQGWLWFVEDQRLGRKEPNVLMINISRLQTEKLGSAVNGD
jgi:hypothetical protein